MIISFSTRGWEDYLELQRVDAKATKRINKLIAEIVRDPFAGLGKPEPLRHEWVGYWSRRIDGEHRLVYKVTDTAIQIAQCRYHY
ncbi:Txe/YoeB family addiction module toxin [Fimbriimonas ginsengisoli]|uniref:Endoribonuclease YoeB n=1 Tax=Fimbriimonas ginsengisoli Gsoil 348 TaxID=661478 RepID=A0A068NP44_FIMGI|nr:Txe/YoeB family addiction module toxin [Fimbriimonas ginsengisoli]AIE85211.1 Toxin yoeB [Fimbriimonas ginsengisoli Gsoil 348]